jgi:hypothetical protein
MPASAISALLMVVNRGLRTITLISIMLLFSRANFVHSTDELLGESPSESLSRDELLAQLQLGHMEPLQVARLLSSARNKDTTEVVDGITVAQLLALRKMQIADCNLQALRQRLFFCATITNSPLVSVELYCRRMTHEAAEFCLQHYAEVGVDNLWLGEVGDALVAMKSQAPLAADNMRLTPLEWCLLLKTSRYPAQLVPTEFKSITAS